MAISGVITAQTGARQFNPKNFTKYSMFVGGVNASHHALRNYSPLVSGYGRLFMVRPPYAIAKMFAGADAGNLYSSDSLFMQFKHMLEYMPREITGFGDKTLEVAGTPIQGGFAGRQFNTPTVTKESTTEFQVGLYELDGLPVMTVIDGWMNAIGDENSGLATYGGWISGGADNNGIEKRLFKKDGEGDEGIPYNEAMHTAEFIYLVHDKSGSQVERALYLADCFPKGISQGEVMNMGQAGDHNNVTYTISFNCVVYRSPIITAIANDLLKQYRIVSNSLNFNPELGDAIYASGDASMFNKALGPVPTDSATGTNIGNMPVFTSNNAPVTIQTANKDMNTAKLAGQSDLLTGTSWDGFET